MSDSRIFKKFEKELNELSEKLNGKDKLEVIYNMQCELMKRYGHEPTWIQKPFTYKETEFISEDGIPLTECVPEKAEERTKLLLDMVHALDAEVSELRDELPWKHWKNYKKEDLWYENEDKKIALGMELIDILHFLCESLILAGFDAEDVYKMYLVKNIENFSRQDEGYDNNYEEYKEE